MPDLMCRLQDDPDPASAPPGNSRTAKQTSMSTPSTAKAEAPARQPDSHASRPRRSRLALVTSSADRPMTEANARPVAVASTQQGRASKKAVKGAQEPETTVEAASSGIEVETDSQIDRTGAQGGGSGQGKTDGAGRSIEELAVRFSQATKELQVIDMLLLHSGLAGGQRCMRGLFLLNS